MRDRSSTSSTNSCRRRALRSIMSTKRTDRLGIAQRRPRSVSAADATAAIGVRSSCETLATKFARQGLQAPDVGDIDEHGQQPRLSDIALACTSTRRGLRPAISISLDCAPSELSAVSSRRCSSALRMTSMATRPTASLDSASISAQRRVDQQDACAQRDHQHPLLHRHEDAAPADRARRASCSAFADRLSASTSSARPKVGDLVVADLVGAHV